MARCRRMSLLVIALVLNCILSLSAAENEKPVRYARFRVADRVAFGIVEGDRVREISGNLFREWKPTETTHALKDVRLLVPTRPTQVLALAGNYKSHLNDSEVPPKFRIPQPFHKGPSCLLRHGGTIVIPADATPNVHYEAELVIVIGKKASKVPRDKAGEYVFGVTCGNDVSERVWQNDADEKDIQWWRAKGANTFGPCGPFIATGLNYDDLKLELRLNGEVRQQERTSLMIHDVAGTVSYISQYVTLYPGDLIFTGTPGKTAAIKAGDVVEIELEGVGVLRNRVAKAKTLGE